MCLTPSRMISGNHSGFEGPTTCGGNTRAIWAAQLNQDPQPAWAALLFTEVFGVANPYATTGTGSPTTLGAVLLDSIAGGDGNTNSISGFASYIIAAYLNAFYNVVNVGTVLTPAQVIHMWNDVIGAGEFCPQLNMCWNATGVIAYLQYSGIVPS